MNRYRVRLVGCPNIDTFSIECENGECPSCKLIGSFTWDPDIILEPFGVGVTLDKFDDVLTEVYRITTRVDRDKLGDGQLHSTFCRTCTVVEASVANEWIRNMQVLHGEEAAKKRASYRS